MGRRVRSRKSSISRRRGRRSKSKRYRRQKRVSRKYRGDTRSDCEDDAEIADLLRSSALADTLTLTPARSSGASTNPRIDGGNTSMLPPLPTGLRVGVEIRICHTRQTFPSIQSWEFRPQPNNTVQCKDNQIECTLVGTCRVDELRGHIDYLQEHLRCHAYKLIENRGPGDNPGDKVDVAILPTHITLSDSDVDAFGANRLIGFETRLAQLYSEKKKDIKFGENLYEGFDDFSYYDEERTGVRRRKNTPLFKTMHGSHSAEFREYWRNPLFNPSMFLRYVDTLSQLWLTAKAYAMRNGTSS